MSAQNKPKLTDTGKRLTAEQAKSIIAARTGGTFSINLDRGQNIYDMRPPHELVREAALAHGLPMDQKYGADTGTGIIYFVEYPDAAA